ncbi:MAG: TusE/DsrC/DsvC family sulfur relay protein [Betaproteobacteria bacterium]|nr:TusE/DsrC/DsvC family sulfur relay protein [Betaproteobacteria bacterium]
MMTESFDTSMLIRGVSKDPEFPHAPLSWVRGTAQEMADQEGLAMTDEHWEVIRALQDFYERHEGTPIHLRELHDALDEKFHVKGGIKHLFEIFPGGPIAQGCRLAGLKAPFIASDRSFGSVA